MSVWLTPDLKPIFGGTYFPPKDAYGRPGFPTLLKWISDVKKFLQNSNNICLEMEKCERRLEPASGESHKTNQRIARRKGFLIYR